MILFATIGDNSSLRIRDLIVGINDSMKYNLQESSFSVTKTDMPEKTWGHVIKTIFP